MDNGQEDPLSAQLFIISIIPLIQAIKENKRLKGIDMTPRQAKREIGPRTRPKTVKGSYYSDDSINIACDITEVEIILDTYQNYTKCSNLEVNASKTNITTNHDICREDRNQLIRMKIKEENITNLFHFLGYSMKADKASDDFMSSKEVLNKIGGKIRKSIAKWSLNELNIAARAAVANTMISSIFSYYLMAILPKRNEEMNKLQKTVDKAFMGNRSITKGNQRYLPLKNAGLGIPNIEHKTTAMTSYWIKMLLKYQDKESHIYPQALIIPNAIMDRWNLETTDLFNSTDNDLKLLAYYAKKGAGSILWEAVFTNLIKIREAFKETTDVSFEPRCIILNTLVRDKSEKKTLEQHESQDINKQGGTKQIHQKE